MLVLLAALVACSLIGGSVGTVLLDRGEQSEPEAGGEAVPEGEFERSLREAIAADPNDAMAMASLANLLATVGNREEAIDWYERALAVAPDDRQVRLDFATTLADAGQRADAELQFRRLMEADPSDPDPAFYLAELYAAWEPPRTAEAAALYRTVVDLAPDAYLAGLAREALAGLAGGAGSPGPTPTG
jgi:predicted Zn-dependent protease